ncbi:MAG: ATP-binding protein [Planctomycetes bacterium]|nr:ATP-binding protein [Planctomycetota bacterium]
MGKKKAVKKQRGVGDGPICPTVNIRPGVSVLAVLAHLEYRTWYALAEYVDNSIQSFLDHRKRLAGANGGKAIVRIDIEVDSAVRRLVIRDNAAGIALEDFPRAFRPAELPPDCSGLCEFGMGMKSASCWFAPRWTVRTSALGEPIERQITFDIKRILADCVEELEVEERPVGANEHYTIVELLDSRNVPVGRTSGKVKEHLTDIYREYLRTGEFELWYRGEKLSYEEPEILEAPPFNANNDPKGETCEWRKDIDFDFGQGMRVRGFAGLLKTGSTKYAGFSLFRRRRVIQGSGDEKYRPPVIFGSPNMYVYQRLFGELHLEGFEVSHTKAGFRWDENEEPFLGILKDYLDSDELPLLRQARNYRERAARALRTEVADRVLHDTATSIKEHAPEVFSTITSEPPDQASPPEQLTPSVQLSDRRFEIEVDGVTWRIELELTTDEVEQDWLGMSETGDIASHTVHLRVGAASAFMKRIVKLDDDGQLEPVVRLAAGLGLAEHLARLGGASMAGSVRRNLNRLLADALSKRT